MSLELSVAGTQYWRMVPLAILTLGLWFGWLKPKLGGKKEWKEKKE